MNRADTPTGIEASETLGVEVEGPVLSLVLNDPTNGNRLTPGLLDGLTRSVTRASVNSDLRAIGLSATGPDFCAGKAPIAQPIGSLEDAYSRQEVVCAVRGFYAAVESSRLPIVAAVQGKVSGLGWALAATCDFVIAAEDATFHLPELDQHLPPVVALAPILRGVLARPLLYEIAQSNTIDAATLFQLGGLSAVVAPEGLLDDQSAVLRKVVTREASVLGAIKRLERIAPTGDTSGATLGSALLAEALLSLRRPDS